MSLTGEGVSNFTEIATNDEGTWKAGTHTVVIGEASAVDQAEIDTGLTSITAFQVQIYRSNVPVFSNQVVTASGGTITVASGATYEITAGDVIQWFAIGVL